MPRIGLVVVAVALPVIGFFALYRPWHLMWGSTREEVTRGMPGDEVVLAPTFSATRAVTVEGRPEAIWPWIVQIGFGRAGWYSYDVLDNLGHHSAEHIIPELQHIEVGDPIPVGPGENAGMRDQGVRTEPVGAVVGTEPTHDVGLVPRADTQRAHAIDNACSITSSWRHPTTAIWLLLVEVADFPMMRKCLLGIKRRAEVQE
jgi:hypothetical protein